jgi:hypothetical protein
VRVAIIQSNFIPWRGYFDIIDDVDLFIYHDDLQYTKGDWRNRNKILTANGQAWVTVPVKYLHTGQLIIETKIDYSAPWVKKITNRIRESYQRAEYFSKYSKDFFEILGAGHETISELNRSLNAWIMDVLEIDTPVRLSLDFSPTGKKTDRLIELLSRAGAKSYLSGPAAKDYIEVEKFQKADIGLEYKSYAYKEYPQVHGGFEPNISIIDLIFNCGPTSRDFLKSMAANERVF